MKTFWDWYIASLRCKLTKRKCGIKPALAWNVRTLDYVEGDFSECWIADGKQTSGSAFGDWFIFPGRWFATFSSSVYAQQSCVKHLLYGVALL